MPKVSKSETWIIESTLEFLEIQKQEVWNQARVYLISKCNTRKALKTMNKNVSYESQE